MYDFIDTNESQSSATLPSEAMSIYGEYIEDQVPGYQTLYVSGRESLAADLMTFETGASDGETIQRRRFPARTITVGFQILARSNSEFRTAFNLLNSALYVTEAPISFADEPDKFFIGTPIMNAEPEPGSNSVTAEFEVYCADPFKYSIELHVEEPVMITGTDDAGNEVTQPVFVINYQGTYRSYPELSAIFASTEDTDGKRVRLGECGYVAFVDQNENIIQLGNPEEADVNETQYPMSQPLINQTFKSVANWSANSGKTAGSNYVMAGSMKVQAIKDSSANKTFNCALPAGYGSGSAWHGPCISLTPKDAAGTSGAVNFRFSYQQIMALSATTATAKKQRGCFQALLINADNNSILAGVLIDKSGAGTTATMRTIVNGTVKSTDSIDLSWYNTRFGYTHIWTTTTKTYKWVTKKVKKKKKKVKQWYTKTVKHRTDPVRTTSITKNGAVVTFSIGGTVKKFTVPEIAEAKAHQIVFYFGNYGTYAGLSSNALAQCLFTRDDCERFYDIPNVFAPGQEVVADCDDAEIYLDGERNPMLGALGNDWEDFCLMPGTNQIGIAYSDWVDDAYSPTFKIKYREVFL